MGKRDRVGLAVSPHLYEKVSDTVDEEDGLSFSCSVPAFSGLSRLRAGRLPARGRKCNV